MNFGMTEILIILAIIIILFGARRIPELAKSLGSSMKQFKKGMHEEDEDQEKNS